MALVFPGRISLKGLRADTLCIGSDQPCHYCGSRVGSYQPMLIFGLQRPEIVGAAHPECGYFDFNYAQFGVNASLRLSPSETSLLAYFYYRLFQLPGEGGLRSHLRRCLASLLPDYPVSLTALPDLIAQFVQNNSIELTFYPGDLEIDFYAFLGQVWKSSQEEPLNARVDFS